jgi:HEAT repeats
MLALLMILLATPTTMQPHRAKPPPPPEAGPVTQAKLSPEEVEERIQMYLGSIDRPITAGMWQKLGPAALPALEKIARDPEQLPSKRASALGGISAIGSLTAPDLMLELAKDEKQPMAVRIAAINGAGRVATDERVAQELRPVMENATNGHVRRVAAEVLAAHGGCAAVRAQAKREQNRDRMAKALKACNETQ